MTALPPIPLLDVLEPASREALRAALVLHRFAPGDAIVTAGATDQSLYILLSGSATVVVGGLVITTLGEGALVGEMSFFEPFPDRSADVVAQTAVAAAGLERSSYAALCGASPVAAAGLERLVLGRLAARLAETNAQISELVTAPPVGILERLRRRMGWG